ncbi:transglycosylase domain-containing protein [Sutcliffiella rhizosphaerae]|nr:transglycosylase domain-containing protein [Sutcliffiella rhizosphaerae]
MWNLILIFLVIGLIGVSFAGGAGAGYFAALVREEPIRSYDDMRQNIYNYEESTEMYFADDVYLGKYRADLLREEVSLDQVSKHLINALVSTEDEYFYEHEGVVPKAIVRAIVQEVTNSTNQTGGSTLTQQLIKNQVLTDEVSFDRKAKEILLALRLENYFSKEEILEAYLNVSPFGRDANGRNIAGAKTAAEGIFGVDISELSIPQAAFIAGLPQSPFAYTPFTRTAEVKDSDGLEPGLQRMRYVLSRMYSMGHIDQKQYEDALAYDINKDLTSPTNSAIDDYPYVAFEIENRAQKIIAEQLALNDGYEKEELESNEELYREYIQLADTALRQKGYIIKTTLDKDIYTKMREITEEFPYFDRTVAYKNEEQVDQETGELVRRNAEQVGAILLDNQTGAIISFVGGRDFKISDLNFATNTWRHNGSTMKPLLGYAPAYELGTLQPGSILADTPLTVRAGGQTWTPNNWNNQFNGLVTARESVALSHNLSAIRGYMEILPQRPMDFLFKQNFKELTQQDAGNISAVLGSPAVGVSVEENTAGYVTFANGGNYVEPYLIESITTKDGEVIYEHNVEPVEIYSPQTAYLMIDTMRDTFRRGTAIPARNNLQFSADWAGKTGTTQDTHDVWMMGSNPKVTFGLWLGYDERYVLEKISGYTPTQRSQMLWAQLLNGAYSTNPDKVSTSEQFQMPGGIVRRSYCKLSGLLPSELCQKAGLVGDDLFNAKFAPTKTDDSLTTGKYVQIGDVAYAPLSSTPSEFVKEGPMLKPDFLKKLQIGSIEELAKYMDNKDVFKGLTVLSKDPLPTNNSAPKQVGGVSLSGNTLSWSGSSEKDVIGYYVYFKQNSSSSARKIASVQAGDDLNSKISQDTGLFYVTAVNASGKESSASNTVKRGDPDKKEEEKKETKPENKPPSNGNSGGGNSGGGNSGGGNNGGGNSGGDNSTDPPPDDSGDDGDD